MIILNKYHDPPGSIAMETFTNQPIKNEQFKIASPVEITMEQGFERMYNSKFHGQPTKMYNCHGMTFASRRTGIFEEKEIEKILREEYQEIKIWGQVLVGDVALYVTREGLILHSASVIQVDTAGVIIPIIIVLSKARSYSEIKHNVRDSPYTGSEIKFYRINHGKITII